MDMFTNTLGRVFGDIVPGIRGTVNNEAAMLEEQLRKLSSVGPISVFEPVRMRVSANANSVALYMGSELLSTMMDYVIAVCSHFGYKLSVLTFQSKSMSRALLAPYRQALEKAGVKLEIVTLKGDSVKGLARYLRAHPELAFLICREAGYLGRSYLKGIQRKDAMPVPVVVVGLTDNHSVPDQVAFIEEKSEVNAA